MHSNTVVVNVDAILDAARESGMSPAVAERFRERLAALNVEPTRLVDHRVGKALKVLDRLGDSVFGKVETKAAARALRDDTELAMRIILGQWDQTATALVALKTRQPESDVQEQANADIDRLIEFCKSMDHGHGSHNPEEFKVHYAAHRAACVLACPHADCDQKPGCWETRSWCD